MLKNTGNLQETQPVVIQWAAFETPLGEMFVASSDHGLCSLAFGVREALFLRMINSRGQARSGASCSADAIQQIREYFARERIQFDLPLDLRWSTPFQREVYRVVCSVPYGEMMTYAQVAQAVGRPRAFRAVGAANGQNPLPLVIPCHRLVGSDGKLHGYGAGQGIVTKRWLLAFEGAVT